MNVLTELAAGEVASFKHQLALEWWRALLLWLLLGCTPVMAQLKNGDFEDSKADGTPSAWTLERGKITSDQQKKNSGTYAGKLDGGTGTASACQDVDVRGNSSYTLSGKWRNGDHTAAFDVLRAFVVPLDAAGKEMENPPSASSGDVVSAWTTFVVGPVKIPVTIKRVRIRLQSSFGVGAFDDLRFEEGDGSARQLRKNDEKRETPHAGQSTSIIWVKDLSNARTIAKQRQLGLALFFDLPGDPVVAYFEKNVFGDPAIIKVMAEKYISVRVPYSSNDPFCKALKVSSPGALLLFDISGAAISRIEEKLPVASIEKCLAGEK